MALLSVKECQRIQFILKAHTIDNQRELKFKLEILSSPVDIPFCIVNVTLRMGFLMCGILPIPMWVFRHINFHTLSVLDAFSVIMTMSTCFPDVFRSKLLDRNVQHVWIMRFYNGYASNTKDEFGQGKKIWGI